jgi:acyl carrier protein
MSATAAGRTWEDFATSIALVGLVSLDAVTPDARLIEDLDLDSLALTEVVVMLMTEYDLGTRTELERREWRGVTVGALYEQCLART